MSNGDPKLQAWVDESISSADDNGPAAYVMAAVLADPTQCDDTRDMLRTLRRGREPRLHWHSEEPRRRSQIAAALACINLTAVVTVGTPTVLSKPERARRCCLEQLLFELQQREIRQVWLEARTASLNRKEVRFVDALRAQKVVTDELRVDFGNQLVEPMLWLADAVAGVVAASCRGESEWLDVLRPRITTIDVRVR